MTTKIFSLEDGNISTFSVSSTRTRAYIDIDLSFKAGNVGNIFKKTEIAAVKQSVKTILNSNKFDKPFDPDFGIDLQRYFFDLADETTGADIVERVRSNIQTYEPRASVKNIKVSVLENKNAINISVIFSTVNTDQTITVENTISRLR